MLAVTIEEANVMIEALKAEKANLQESRDFVDIGTIAREQLEKKIESCYELIVKLQKIR